MAWANLYVGRFSFVLRFCDSTRSGFFIYIQSVSISLFFLWLGRHCGRSVQICGPLGQVVVVSTHLCRTRILNKAEYSTVSATVNRHIVSRKFDLKLTSTGLGPVSYISNNHARGYSTTTISRCPVSGLGLGLVTGLVCLDEAWPLLILRPSARRATQ